RVRDRLDAHYARLAAASGLGEAAPIGSWQRQRLGAAYVGAAACSACHPEESQQWRGAPPPPAFAPPLGPPPPAAPRGSRRPPTPPGPPTPRVTAARGTGAFARCRAGPATPPPACTSPIRTPATSSASPRRSSARSATPGRTRT